MSRTAILTLAFYNNFGSVLQAYALQKVVRQITGGEVDVVPYRPPLPEYTYFKSEELVSCYREKCGLFSMFRSEYLGMEGAWITDTGQIEKQYDHYIVGSDIIWGREFSGLDPAYFLDFVPEGKTRAAYAASMILQNGFSEDDRLFARYIPMFDYISVREPSSAGFLGKFTEKPVASVLDPSLLLDQKDYEPLIREDENMPDRPYLLSYFLTHDPAVVAYTNLMAKKLDLKVVHYFADYPKRVFEPEAGCFAFAGPGEFLGYVKHASCIFTNSFHGTCFSAIFHKPFYTYTAKRAMLSRVRDLTGQLGLTDRCFSDYRDLKGVTLERDVSETDSLLRRYREQSMEFLNVAAGGGKHV